MQAGVAKNCGQAPDNLFGSLPTTHPSPTLWGCFPWSPVLIYVYGALPGRRAGSLMENQSTGSLTTYAWPAGAPMEDRPPLQGRMWSCIAHKDSSSHLPIVPDYISHYKWGKWGKTG